MAVPEPRGVSREYDRASYRGGVIALENLLSESVEAARERERSAFDDLARPFENRIVLFGAGRFGRRTLAGLRRVGVEPLAFADNNQALWGKSVEGVPVKSPADAAREFGDNAVFVLTIWNGQAEDRMADRIRQLRELGCARVAPAGLLFWKHPDVFLPYYQLDLPHKVLERAEDVRRAYALWSDESSRQEYVAQIRFRLRLDYDALGRPGPEKHYFPDLFNLSSGEVLVDCGAFSGDTIEAFVRLRGEQFDRILAYEPDPLNWPRLQQTLAALPASIRQKISCFPQAVSASSGTIQFNSTGTDLSSMGSGSLSVECVTLDEALRDYSPTMIKFDIEGAEPAAIRGGARTIRQSAPVLAVSAYHQQSHLWEIPLAIAELHRDYRFALRPHGTEGWDLVCYAIPPHRWSR